eukprot:g6194.t1
MAKGPAKRPASHAPSVAKRPATASVRLGRPAASGTAHAALTSKYVLVSSYTLKLGHVMSPSVEQAKGISVYRREIREDGSFGELTFHWSCSDFPCPTYMCCNAARTRVYAVSEALMRLLVGGPPRAEIARGSWVLLHGLSHSVELNGQEAIVEGMDADRYVVRLVDSHLYKKVRPEHLEPDRTRRSRPSPAVPSPCGEHEFDQPQELPQGPKELAPGAEVWVHGLTTAASMNDRKVLVRCFNPQTERYVVQLVDDDLGGVATGPLRAIKAEHLSLAESESDDGPSASVEAVADDSRGQVLRPGSHGKLVNLRNVAMNGKVVRILGYKEAKHHYVVKLPNGALRRVDASKVERAEDDASIPLPRMSVCNAFGRRLKVLLENSKAISLDFPSCHDFEEVSSSSVLEESTVSAYAFDAKKGELKLLNSVATGNERMLAVANYGGSVALFQLTVEGRISTCLQVPDLGLDRVMVYKLDHGSMDLVKHLPLAPGSGPRHLAFHPELNVVYVLNELLSTVMACHYDAASGELTPTEARPTVFALTEEGLIAEGSPQHFSTAVREVVNPVASWPPRECPRDFALCAEDRYLIAANQDSDSLVVFERHPESGALIRTGISVKCAAPACPPNRSRQRDAELRRDGRTLHGERKGRRWVDETSYILQQNPGSIRIFWVLQDKYDYLFKFIIIGDAGAGKSCLLHQFIDNKFKKGSSHTIGVEFGSKVITVGGRNINYYRGAAGALIVYDITNRDSYNHLVNWLADARTLARADISIITVGNKVDLKEKREVTFLEASRCAQENDILFLETSALTGEGVEDVFIKVARMILNKIEDGLIDPLTMSSNIHAGAQRLEGGSESSSKACSFFPVRRPATAHRVATVMGAQGSLCCCCPPRAEDEDAPLVPPPKLQIGKRGGQVKVTSDHSGLLVTGHGVALANCVVEQDCAYWEIRVLEPGTSSRAFCGVALELNGQRLESTIGDTQTSWAIGGDLPGGPLEKDDIIGVAFGQGAIPNLRFFRNGKEIPGTEVLRIRGEAYPAVSVCDGAELLLVFDSPSFAQDPPGRHTAIVPPRKML